MKNLKLVLPVAAWFLPGPAVADTIAEIDLGVSHNWRGGNALNESGSGREIEDYTLRSIGGIVAHQFDNGFLLQGGLRVDDSRAPQTIDGFIQSNDTYRLGRQVSLQAGRSFQSYYLGAYAVSGIVHSNTFDFDQDANFASFGVQAAWHGDVWLFSGTFGVLDSEADDPETLANAVLLGGSATYAWSDNTKLNFGLSYYNGEQDLDSGSAPDRIDVIVAKAEIEHTVHQSEHDRLAIYGGLSVIDVRENNGGSSFDRTRDTILTAGIRMTFGGSSSQTRPRQKSPPLPEMLRVLGAVPAVD